MRIAMIGSRGLPPTYSGIEQAIGALATRLAARGHEVTVYGRDGHAVAGADGYDGVRQVILPSIRTKHAETVTHTALSTAHALARRRYDVIHFHATGPALFSVFARIRRVPSVATVHGLDWKREKWGAVATEVLKLGARVSATVPTETIVVSEELRKQLAQTYGARSTYIPNGVEFGDLDESEPVEGLSAGSFVLFLGRLVPEKQIHLLIEAFAQIDTEYKLVIAGPGGHADDYVAKLEELASSDPRVTLIGPRYAKEKTWLLRNARVVVQPSTLEGLPITVLEAHATGTEVLVSDIPENLAAITLDDRRMGTTFRTGDRADLTRALTAIIERPPGPPPVPADVVKERYSWDEIALQTESVYQQAHARG
jgi:glycosyltransferase involved in cell wall biosynthesis